MTEIETSPYPSLFAHPRLVADLVRGYVREAWAARLDLGSLEPWTAANPLEDTQDPAGPTLVWRLRWRGGRSWVYLLLGFQAEVDPHMALRLLLRTAGLYLGLIDSGALPRSWRRPALPAVLPIVVYHGEELWTAPRDMAELFAPLPHGLDRYVLHLHYVLLDAAREPIPETAAADNLVSVLFRLERSRTLDEVAREAARLERILSDRGAGTGADTADDTERSALRLAFTAFLNDPLLPRRFPGAVLPVLGEIAPIGWGSRWADERRALARLLIRLLEGRFGPLTDDERRRIERADAECLLAWGERAPAARSLEEVFAAAG